MEHREAHHGAESVVGQPGIAAVTVQDARSVAVQLLQPLGHGLVHLDSGYRVGPVDECAQRCAVTGSDFEGLVAQLDIGERPRQQLVADRVGPARGTTPPPMQHVHRHDVMPSVEVVVHSGRYERQRLTASENMPGYIEKPPRLRSAAFAHS
jgi:hypothetical protein